MKFDNRPLLTIIKENPNHILVDTKNIMKMFDDATVEPHVVRIFYRCYPTIPRDTDIIVTREDNPLMLEDLSRHISLKPIVTKQIVERVQRNRGHDEKQYDCVICYCNSEIPPNVTACCGTVVCHDCVRQLRSLTPFLKCPGCQCTNAKTILWDESYEQVDNLCDSFKRMDMFPDIKNLLILCDQYTKVWLNFEL